jgi:hypothetical protein
MFREARQGQIGFRVVGVGRFAVPRLLGEKSPLSLFGAANSLVARGAALGARSAVVTTPIRDCDSGLARREKGTSS